jgi:N6-adenosine-specific RNA methylase IME4
MVPTDFPVDFRASKEAAVRCAKLRLDTGTLQVTAETVSLGQIIDGCGYTYTTELLNWIKVDCVVEKNVEVWIKLGAFGEGKTARKGVENVWGAKRGKGIPIRDHSVDQRIFARKGKHSEKPDGAYHALERLYGNVRRLELFGTKPRPGWTVWGHIDGSEFVTRLYEQGLLQAPRRASG